MELVQVDIVIVQCDQHFGTGQVIAAECPHWNVAIGLPRLAAVEDEIDRNARIEQFIDDQLAGRSESVGD